MAEADALEALMGRLPEKGLSSIPNPRCCCGKTDCAYLRHNCTALDDLEQEVRTAAQLGQALLVRHEAYMVDAERDRLELGAKIERLEADKKELEATNSKTIEENRGLLNQLEVLNSTVSESESHIKSLEATLQSTNQELRRLEGLAARTQDLEIQLAALEQEQVVLQNTITKTEAEERSVFQRWKQAERGLCALQDQLERIEREAREERERHIEVLGRMERQRAVERELDTAAGRLKGAAALTAGTSKNGSSVVSHFVKDILQDNANLQLGIVELREMLTNSNEEVQTLREQLMLHQPIVENAGVDSGPSTLQAELASKEEPEPKVISQELHIHHHYHAPKKEEIRRPKKKRMPINTAEEWTASFQPTLHRSTSHESILSISGLDIHTLKSRPSQMTITGRGLQPQPSLGSLSSILSLNTLTSSSTIIARPTLSRHGHNSTALGKKVGGWVFGRWGMTPAKSSSDLRSALAALSPTQQRVVSSPVDPLKAFMGRAPGVNQKGPVPGFVKKTERPPSNVKPEVVDRDALKDILSEGSLP
ncbi:hypothetical protein OIDMADRAFT_154101 [Oidiodendron maius Zn]|uniref:Uncharacterized protein n=1 Tax=Oidiodendron maius (strain Zn) TaxID=913774 RepID=A0A0C3HTZ5_OIDMZ|nr:hypothetical protein OIDMADRAFT_154101 [Oidiodendron maius Zn]